jgi:type 1 fimbria pilin
VLRSRLFGDEFNRSGRHAKGVHEGYGTQAQRPARHRSISLNCDRGVRVALTLTDVTTPANRSTTLTLTPDSTAKGVGYQISFGGVPVAYGADTAAAGNQNQIFVSSMPTIARPLSVLMSVSYVRTGAVVPGSANASVTFNMSYQ